MNKKQLVKKFNRWHDDDLHSKIIDAISEIPHTERDYELICILARAYNNVGKYLEAIELLEGVKEEGKNDIFWYYRIAFAYGLNYEDEEYIDKAIYYLEEALLTDVIFQDKQIASEIQEMLSDLYESQAEKKEKIEKESEEYSTIFSDVLIEKQSSKIFSIKEDLQNGTTSREIAFSILDEMSKEFKKPAISISLKRTDDLSITQSKVAGLPYIPIGEEIPIGTENRQLSLFAQINCSDLPENDLYPKEGILQFWFLDNFEMGIDWNDLTNQDNFRVIYHKEIGEHYTEEKLREILNPYREDEPLFGENSHYEMSFKTIDSHLNFSSLNFDEEFCARWNSKCEPEIRWVDDLENIDDYLTEEIWDAVGMDDAMHQIGGYPKFTQEDPRYGSEEYGSFETLMLQVDSQFNKEENTWEILFGDVGICNFFIEPEKLKKCDFSRVMFTMDCH